MITNELMNLKVLSPFNDEFYLCQVKVEISREDNGKFVGGNLISVVTDGGHDLCEWLNQEKLDDIETEFLEIYEA